MCVILAGQAVAILTGACLISILAGALVVGAVVAELVLLVAGADIQLALMHVFLIHAELVNFFLVHINVRAVLREPALQLVRGLLLIIVLILFLRRRLLRLILVLAFITRLKIQFIVRLAKGHVLVLAGVGGK